ncbi:MAG: hypothetical protein AB7F35_27075 [Acetobacteraceae bacterium]
MTDNRKAKTHIAWGFRREGKKHGRLLEIGMGWIDHENNKAGIVLDRLPLGAFTGFVTLLPIGEKPPAPEAQPQRPGQGDDEEEGEG